MKTRTMLLKRVVDVGLAFVALIVLAPLLLATAAAVKLDSPGPIFYLSQRLGRRGRPFTMYKFRSMYVNSPVLRNHDGSTRVDPGDARVTRVGRLLRLGFDELPQLINVLKGDMSLIGPRPDPPEALAYYSYQDLRKLVVRPGITGLAQVSGRNDIPWRQRLDYDLAYIEAYSITLDIRIALCTVLEFIPPLRARRFHARMVRSELTIAVALSAGEPGERQRAGAVMMSLEQMESNR